MAIFEAIKIAFLDLGRHKLRTILTMLGRIFCVGAVLALLSIGAGAEQAALTAIQKMGLRNIIVKAKTFEREELRVLRQDTPSLSLRDTEALKKVLTDGTVVVAKKELKTFQIASQFGKSDPRVIGVTSNYPQVANQTLVEGAFFLPVDERYSHQVCVLGTTAKRKLFGLNDAIGR